MGGKGGKRNEKRGVSKTGLKGKERETNSESWSEGSEITSLQVQIDGAHVGDEQARTHLMRGR